MNFAKTREISADIFRMIRQMYENQTVSPLEKDLLKEKLRRLYEALDEIDSNDQSELSNMSETPSVPVPATSETPTEPPVTEVQAILDFTHPSTETSEIVPEPFLSEDVTARPIQPEPVMTAPAQPAPEVKVNTSVPTPEPTPVAVLEIKEKPATPNPKAPLAEESTADVQDLFVFAEAKELLEKLRQTPVADISKAFTLNEKLQYAKALFNNDTEKMNQLLARLNQLNNFEEAREVLLSEAVFTYHWEEKDKKKLAKELIQVVHRRFIKA
jgi:hypothetical protein